jgi:hypothetical protein
MYWYPAFGLKKLLLALALIFAFPIFYVASIFYLATECGFSLLAGMNHLLVFFDTKIPDDLRVPVGGTLTALFFLLLIFFTRKLFIKIMKWLARPIFGEGHLRDLLK